MFKRLFCWAYFRGSLFSEGLIIGRNFEFQNGLGLTIKTASTNSPWAYIREGLLSKGFVRLRFGGLIFGRAFFFFWGGGGLIIGILRYIEDHKKYWCLYLFCNSVKQSQKITIKNLEVDKKSSSLNTVLELEVKTSEWCLVWENTQLFKGYQMVIKIFKCSQNLAMEKL